MSCWGWRPIMPILFPSPWLLPSAPASLSALITFNRKAAEVVLYLAGIMMTIPSIALFGIMILLSIFGKGIGVVPAAGHSQLPIIRNTYAAIRSVDPSIIDDAGIGDGVRPAGRCFFNCAGSMALGVIFAGVRVALCASASAPLPLSLVREDWGTTSSWASCRSNGAMTNAGGPWRRSWPSSPISSRSSERLMVSKGLRLER